MFHDHGSNPPVAIALHQSVQKESALFRHLMAEAIEVKLSALEEVCKNNPNPNFSGLQCGARMQLPIEIKGSERCTTESLAEIAHQYKLYGFALIKNAEGIIPAERLPGVSDNLALGDLYVPPYFKLMAKSSSVTKEGVAVISQIGSGEKAIHGSFQTTRGEGLHVDGTVAAIGEVRTSFLFCNSPAAEGGESLLFNAVGACLELYRRNPKLVAPLFNQEAMKRGKEEMGGTRVGPVFDIVNGELVTRFSVNDTTDWEYGFARVKGLDRAVNALMDYTMEGSPYMLKFLLSRGTGVIMANDKVCHGRLSYTNSAEVVRKMARTLHRARPGEFA